MYDTQKKIATAIANAIDYKEPLLDKTSTKLFTETNTNHKCMMCGQVRKKGYIDKRKQLFGDKTNSFYSFANPQSDFLCSYCYYNYKLYKKMQQKNYINPFFIEEIQNTFKNEEKLKLLKKAYETLCLDLKTKYFDENGKCTLDKSQKEKIAFMLSLQDKESDIIELTTKLIPKIFNYDDIANFATNINLHDFAKKYANMNDVGDCYIDNQNNIVPLDCKSTSKDNGLYKLFRNPPKPPFIVLLKHTKSSTFVDNAHTAVATVDRDTIIINFGITTYIVPRKKVFECLDKAEDILKRHRKNKTKKQEEVTISDDVLFNRANSPLYSNYFTSKLRNNGLFMQEYINFVNSYDKGVRFVAKIILETYRQNLKKER